MLVELNHLKQKQQKQLHTKEAFKLTYSFLSYLTQKPRSEMSLYILITSSKVKVVTRLICLFWVAG